MFKLINDHMLIKIRGYFPSLRVAKINKLMNSQDQLD